MSSLTKLIDDLGVELDAVVALLSKDNTNKEAIRSAITDFKSSYKNARTGILEYDTPGYKEFNDARKQLKTIGESFDSLQRKAQTSSSIPDVVYGVLVFVLVATGTTSANLSLAWLGWITVVVAGLTLVAVLIIAGVRSNTTYSWDELAARLYNWLPSRFFALFIVPGFLIAIWLGFGGVYAGDFCMGTWDALYHSGLTISTLGYGLGEFPSLDAEQVLALKKVMLAQRYTR